MNSLNVDKNELKASIAENVKTLFRKTISTANKQEIYQAAVFSVRNIITDMWIDTHNTYEKEDSKIVYYLSMEFLMGRFFGNSVINLMLNDTIKEVFEELEIDYNEIENQEPDPGLGNGGLGRLAACFLDSLATMEYPAYGCGIRYRYGIFEQKIIDGEQVEVPDNWLKDGDPWSIRRSEYAVNVMFGGNVRGVDNGKGGYKFIQENYQLVRAIPYDYPVVGYNNNTINTLRLWDAEAINTFDLNSFNKGQYDKAVEEQNLARTIAEVLYPADEHYQGKELRLKQQYFFISATVQRAVNKYKQYHNDFSQFPDKVAFQLNDTHPTVAIPELMRILIDQEELEWDEAWDITQKVCGYTNHTIMAEALEKWPVELFSRLLPRIYQIVEEINRRYCILLRQKYGNDNEKIGRMSIVANGQIHMARLAIVGSHSVNGVAALHTEILKKQELKDFYDLYPEKFNNKTNGITQRRWLLHSNPKLAELITNKVGNAWITDLTKIKEIEKFAEDEEFQRQFMSIKYNNKLEFIKQIKEETGIEVNPDSIFDVQVKRLHEYKRQLLNVFHIIYLYNQLMINPNLDIEPRTFIFAAKSAASYKTAKMIIKLINNVADVVNNDPIISKKIKVVFMPNYRVSMAESLIPAADVSEQISTASKEASGTGNMKFMLNGAVTIGTMDGANVEIYEEVGEDNIFIFGLSSDEVIKMTKEHSYNPWNVYNTNQDVRLIMTQLINGTFSQKDPELFRELYNSLLNGKGKFGAPDEYFILQDFDAYVKAQKQVDEAYRDKKRWAKMAILNTANSGKFSSDRTIKQYAEEIWNLKTVKISKSNI